MTTRGLGVLGALAVAGAVTGVAGDAGAQMRRVDAPWRVSVEVGARWHHDVGLDAFGDTRSPPVTGLTVARDVARLGDRWALAVDANWSAEMFQGRLRQALQTRLTTHVLSAGVSARWRLLWWLEPYGRLAAGALYSDVNLTPEGDTAGSDLTGDAWTFMASAGLGVQVTTGAFLGPLRFTTSVEGGYMLALDQRMSVRQQALADDAAEADRLPAAETSLGTVNLSGGYLRWMIGFRF